MEQSALQFHNDPHKKYDQDRDHDWPYCATPLTFEERYSDIIPGNPAIIYAGRDIKPPPPATASTKPAKKVSGQTIKKVRALIIPPDSCVLI